MRTINRTVEIIYTLNSEQFNSYTRKVLYRAAECLYLNMPMSGLVESDLKNIRLKAKSPHLRGLIDDVFANDKRIRAWLRKRRCRSQR